MSFPTEAAIRRPIGTRDVMLAQYKRLREAFTEMVKASRLGSQAPA